MGSPFLGAFSSLSLSRKARRPVTSDYFSHKPANTRISNSFFKNAEQNVVIDTIKEFSNITLKYIARLCTISTHSAKHLRQYLNTFVSSFPNAARKRVGDVCWLKNRIQSGEHRMMQHSIANTRFVYMPELGILDIKIGIRSMPIVIGLQIAMQIENIVLQFLLECEHIFFHPLAAFEFIPCAEERLGGGYFIKNVLISFHV